MKFLQKGFSKVIILAALALFSSNGLFGQINVDIGSGSSTTSAGSATSPITQNYSSGLRYQVIYTKAEIEAAGGVAGTISQFGWRVSSNASGLTNYTISLGHTASTTLSSIVTTGLTQVYGPATFAPVNSGSGNYHMLTLSTPFDWNGTDNLIVNVCYTRSTSLPTGGQVYSYSGTSGASRYATGATPCNLSGTGFNNFSTKPQIRMVLTEAPPTGNVDIGSGTSTTGGGSAASPITQNYAGLRYQVIYTKAEIEAAGGIAGAISQFGWRVASNATSLTNYTISFAHTALSTLSNTVTTGLTQVYTTTTFAPVNSGSGNYHMITLNTPFNWNGTDNLLINVCYTRSPTSTSGGTVYSYSGSGVASRYVSNATPCTATTVSNSNFSTKPQMRMVMPIAVSSCETPTNLAVGTVTTTTAQFSWTNGAPTVGYSHAVTTSATPPVSGTDAMGSSITINSGLSAGTGYYFWIRNRCTASSNSDWISVPFATACTAPTLTTTPGSRCGAGSVALGASPSAGTVYWWDAAAGGNFLGTGTSFNTPIISTTTTYYASAGQQLAGNIASQIGAGANTSSLSSENPFETFYTGQSSQYLIKASELLAAGIGAGNITSLGLEVVYAGSTMNNFDLRMNSTTVTDLSSGFVTTSDYYTPTTHTPTAGINTFSLIGTGFYWDGVSNIAITFSYLNGGQGTSSTVKYDNTSFLSSGYAMYSGGSNWSNVSTAQYRPKLIINGKGLCMSARQEVVATVDTGSYTYYRDLDEDGFGDAANSTTVCSPTPPTGYVTNNSDCNDALVTYLDSDGDGFGINTVVPCGSPYNTDCDDSNATVHPGATEICGNYIDDNCNGIAEETCAVPANNNPAFNSPNMTSGNFVYPNCFLIQGTTSGSTISPYTGNGDVWYQFVAQTNGVSIKVNSTVIDAKIYLIATNDLNTIVDEEDAVTGTGTEILNFGGLIPGQSYYIGVGAMGVTEGPFSLCVQQLRKAACGNNAPYNLCTLFKSTVTGATSTTFQFTEGSTTTSITSANSVNLGTSALQLVYGHTYNVSLTANYELTNGAGQIETISVSNPNTCSITLVDQPSIEVRSNQWCSNGATLYRNSYIQGSPVGVGIVCGITGYQIEFTPVTNCAGDNPNALEKITRTISGTSTAYSLTGAFGSLPLASNPFIGYWSVVYTPIFHGGVLGNPSTTPRVIAVNGTSSSSGTGMDAFDGANENSLGGSISTSADANLYPNPNNGDMVNLNMTGITNGEVFVRIIDGMGKVVYTNRYTVEGSLNTLATFGKPLATGIYMVEFISGNDVIIQKMMVGR